MKFFSRNKEKYKVPAVPGILLSSRRGCSTMRKVAVEEGEITIDPENKVKVYTGVVPQVTEIYRDILPSWFARRFCPKKFRARIHYRLFDQPFTRDLYTGDVLDFEKQDSVLKERGFMDKDGFIMDAEGKNRMIIRGCYAKVDVSPIDYINSEFHALHESKSAENIADAMEKTGQTMDKWMYIVLIASLIANVIVIFLATGGAEGWF